MDTKIATIDTKKTITEKMQNQFSRTQLLMGKPAINTLMGSRVAVFGVGGVGGYVVEALVRSGLGEIDLIDDDRVCLTNVNRQVIATLSSVGKHKVDVCEERIRDINRRCIVHKYQMFYLPEFADAIDISKFDYVVDCIDTVSAKIELAKRCHKLGVPIISCMGAANKIDATAFKVSDISKTKMDPLAKVMRKKMKELGIRHLKVVYSEEQPLQPFDDASISCRFHCICPNKDMRKCTDRRNIPASNAFVPAAAGLIVGGEVVKDLINIAGTMRIAPDAVGDSEAAAAALAKAEAHKRKVSEARLRAKEAKASKEAKATEDVKEATATKGAKEVEDGERYIAQ